MKERRTTGGEEKGKIRRPNKGRSQGREGPQGRVQAKNESRRKTGRQRHHQEKFVNRPDKIQHVVSEDEDGVMVEDQDSGWAYGRQAVMEALKAGTVRRLYLARRAQGAGIQAILELARSMRVPTERHDQESLRRLVGDVEHQGVAARVHARPLESLEELLDRVRGEEEAVIVVAAGIQDPRNLGALARSAEAAGARGLILPRHRSAGVTSLALKASAGALAHLPVAETTNLSRCLQQLKQEQFWIFGADPGAEQAYTKADLTGRVVIVVGGEGKGIPRLIREHCDILLRIPMHGKVQSLNAAVAGALLLFEASRQLTEKQQ